MVSAVAFSVLYLTVRWLIRGCKFILCKYGLNLKLILPVKN